MRAQFHDALSPSFEDLAGTDRKIRLRISVSHICWPRKDQLSKRAWNLFYIPATPVDTPD
jgi:hypothetical protein